MCELKKKIPSFQNYAICPHGEVISIKTGNILKTHKNIRSYQRICLRKESKSYHRFVHCLVAETFIGPRPEGKQVDHIDGNKDNNHYYNLRYLTQEENLSRRVPMGKMRKGSNHGMSKISENQAKEIRLRHKRYHRTKSNTNELAKEYGISPSMVRLIINRINWKHI